MIIGIIAISKNYAIGKGGKLPWHYSSDLKFFKRTTVGNAVVMGATTWREIGKPLPHRLNIVFSRSRQIDDLAGAVTLSSKPEVAAIANYLRCDTFIAGGAKTFEVFSEDIEKWYVTEIPEVIPDADTFIPKTFLDGFKLNETIELEDGLKVKTFLRM
jgi:dihydrofolate reductase